MIRNRLQEYLIQNKANEMTDEELIELMKPLRVDVFFEDGLVIFMYGIRADFSNPIVQNCRGIILYRNTLEIACYPFNKFNDYDDKNADAIDWESARILEKIDGQITKVWFNKLTNNWVISTQSSIYADNSLTMSGKSRGELFRNAKSKIDYNLLNKDCTYIFELVSPDSQIILKYENTDIYHIGTRNNISQLEEDADIGVQKPKNYEVKSLKEAIDKANEICKPGDRHEGFVVVDKDFHRVKVKSNFYKQSAYIMHSIYARPKVTIKFIRDNEEYLDEMYELMPDIKHVIKYYEWQMEEVKYLLVKILGTLKKKKKECVNKADYIKEVDIVVDRILSRNPNIDNDKSRCFKNIAYKWFSSDMDLRTYINTLSIDNYANTIKGYERITRKDVQD